jgi:ABC-type tungstate transport system substrate-binding protein
VDHRVALFGQIYSDQNMVVGHEVLLLRVAILVSMAGFKRIGSKVTERAHQESGVQI